MKKHCSNYQWKHIIPFYDERKLVNYIAIEMFLSIKWWKNMSKNSYSHCNIKSQFEKCFYFFI